MQSLPRYDWQQSYQWNYDHAPATVAVEIPVVPGNWTYAGLSMGSPLAVAAGPLLNGRWCLYYASLGFDTVTYKTVRTSTRPCYPLPNLQPVVSAPLDGSESSVLASPKLDGSWAVSFGMPSQPPKTWQADVAEARRLLPAEKVLSVSVVGTMQSGWSTELLAADYANCARQAAECGADVIEFNLSCPNVASCDGQLYRSPRDAAIVARAVKASTGGKPIVAKIGYLHRPGEIPPLLDALSEYVTAIATTNCIAVQVRDAENDLLFEGRPRGIAGRAILEASVRQTEAISAYIARANMATRVIGVGGISSAADASRYLSAGAEAIQIATRAMLEPAIALKIRKSLVGRCSAS